MKSQHTRKIALKRADDFPERPQAPKPPARPQPSQIPLTATKRAQITANETSNMYGLEIVLERLQRCFANRISTAEIEVLEFSLRQLFEQANLLFGQLLPELALYANHLPDDGELTRFYNIKTLLQYLDSTLEWLNPLVQLILKSTTMILEALDRSCSLYGAARVKKRLLLQGEDEETTEVLAAIEVALIPDSTYYQWMQALRIITVRLQGWQQQQMDHRAFSALFAEQVHVNPALDSIGTTLPLLLDCFQTIFGSILPEFHTVARGDDETATVHLLNLIQYTDLLRAHVDSLLQSFRLLDSYYQHPETQQ
ncbi:hypothetical protein KDA_27290 [Dictyobacter alpinus]|uniref:Uncharacterized protein n=1 Tax=Dictyobacter alpinus TaxID=2014873 RepID=A0A402B7B6_9CHLR|nr:hypothetical protein [Dictyobacter alpinus]GCE27245.1 hypothetical protein KDA_27290 [Dictyobacter alpinus]